VGGGLIHAAASQNCAVFSSRDVPFLFTHIWQTLNKYNSVVAAALVVVGGAEVAIVLANEDVHSSSFVNLPKCLKGKLVYCTITKGQGCPPGQPFLSNKMVNGWGLVVFEAGFSPFLYALVYVVLRSLSLAHTRKEELNKFNQKNFVKWKYCEKIPPLAYTTSLPPCSCWRRRGGRHTQASAPHRGRTEDVLWCSGGRSTSRSPRSPFTYWGC